MCIWRGPTWAWGHVRVEALLAGRTVFGDSSGIEDLRCDARAILQDGLTTLQSISSLVNTIRSKIASVNSFEVCVIHCACESILTYNAKEFFKQMMLRHDCLRDLRTIVTILDIHPDWHALRTLLKFDGVKVADQIRPSLFRKLPDDREVSLTEEDHQFWRLVWKHVQGSSPAMYTFDTGASWGSKYIHHMLAQMQIAQAFELGQTPDPTLYERVVR
jgi:hypothetical protein